ncbi:MAG: erythromycin esterase family protein [Bacteroidota bacterium]
MKFTSTLFAIIVCFQISFAQKVSKIYKNEIYKYTHEIKSLDSDDFSDLNFLVELFKDKKYIFIGESSHETAEQYLLKTRLVKFLHQKLGFKVLAFEHQLGTTTYFNEIKNYNIPDSALVKYIYHFYPKEFLPLINYLKNTDLNTTGFDFFMESPKRWYPALKNNFTISDSLLISDSIFFNFISKPISLIDTIIFNKLKKELPLLWKKTAFSVEKSIKGNPVKKCLQKSMLIRAENIIKMGDWNITLRDFYMAEYLQWLMTEVYPNDKMIIWAQNGHIAKYNPDLKPSGSSRNVKLALIGNMGQRIPQKIKDQSYFLGIYNYRGYDFTFNNKPIKVLKSGKDSFISIMMSSNYNIAFSDFSRCKHDKSNNWMFIKNKINTNEKFIPFERFDGVIVIRNANLISLFKNDK